MSWRWDGKEEDEIMGARGYSLCPLLFVGLVGKSGMVCSLSEREAGRGKSYVEMLPVLVL